MLGVDPRGEIRAAIGLGGQVSADDTGPVDDLHQLPRRTFRIGRPQHLDTEQRVQLADVPGLLAQFAKGADLWMLAEVQPTPGQEPCAPVTQTRPDEQHPAGNVAAHHVAADASPRPVHSPDASGHNMTGMGRTV